MTVITFRLSEKEKTTLEKYGKISDVVRDAIRLYIDNKKAKEAVRTLKELQRKYHVNTTTDEIVRLIREDREGS